MKLAFAIATITTLQQAVINRADCNFGSNYTSYFNSTAYCPFDVGFGKINLSTKSDTVYRENYNITATVYRRDYAIWKVGEKNSTVQCYSDIMYDEVATVYPNGSTFVVSSGDFSYKLDNNDTVADGVPMSVPGLYYFQEGRIEYWVNDGHGDVIKAGGNITNLCEVLGGGGGGGAVPAPTSTPPTTEAPSSGQMAVVTIIPCVVAATLNYFIFI